MDAMRQGYKEEIQKSQALTGALITTALVTRHAPLKDQFCVCVDYTLDWFFRARITDGGKVKLEFGIGAAHPRFVEMVREAFQAVYQVRFTSTNAVEVRK